MTRMTQAYGVHVAQALLARTPERILEAFVLEGRSDERLRELVTELGTVGLHVQRLTRAQLDKLAGDGAVHQGVVLHIRDQSALDENDLEILLDGLSSPAFLLVLDEVTDPHNLGACLRTADAAGVHAVITTRDRAAGLTATARKVASGAAEILPFVQVTNLARTLRSLQERGIWIIGTALAERAEPFYGIDFTGPLAIVMGAEGSGLRRLTAEHCDRLALIPMAGTVQSLNVSVATGVVLFEALRQRQGRG